MPDKMNASCPKCGAKYIVPALAVGKSTACKACGQRFTVAALPDQLLIPAPPAPPPAVERVYVPVPVPVPPPPPAQQQRGDRDDQPRRSEVFVSHHGGGGFMSGFGTMLGCLCAVLFFVVAVPTFLFCFGGLAILGIGGAAVATLPTSPATAPATRPTSPAPADKPQPVPEPIAPDPAPVPLSAGKGVSAAGKNRVEVLAAWSHNFGAESPDHRVWLVVKGASGDHVSPINLQGADGSALAKATAAGLGSPTLRPGESLAVFSLPDPPPDSLTLIVVDASGVTRHRFTAARRSLPDAESFKAWMSKEGR